MFARLTDQVIVGDSILVEIPGWLAEQGVSAVVYVAPRGNIDDLVPVEFDYYTMTMSADEILAHELAGVVASLENYARKEFPMIVGRIFICSAGGLNLAPTLASYCFGIPYASVVNCYADCKTEITRVRAGTNKSLGTLLATRGDYDYRVTPLDTPPRAISFTSHKNLLTGVRCNEINWAAAR